jgi:hypothetical protein
MKCAAALLLSFGLCGCGLAVPPEGKVAVEVVDENGILIDGARIKVIFESEPGKDTIQEGLSVTNESFVAQTPIVQPYVTVEIQKDGYYKSAKTYMFKGRDNVKNRYMPWGEKKTLTMREVVNPQAGLKGSYHKNAPKFNAPLGFDVVEGDWVKPYGNGLIRDFVFTVHQREDGRVSEYTISFSNEGDGIQDGEYLYKTTSIFRWPYQAPTTGYKPDFKKVIGYKGVDVKDEERIKDPGKSRYVFRVRTEYDENGEIKSALYGKIKGEIIVFSKGRFQFGYWLNDDPHSRCLESTHPTSP